jgi:predicted dehydrogenase
MKVAVIGRGFGSSAMAPAYEALGCEVEVVPSRDVEAVLQACETADLVSIHSPPFQHLDHVLAAIHAGKPVLCDKPFGRNADDARQMFDAAEQAGVPHFLNFEFRANAARRKVAELLADGAIGSVRHAHYVSIANYLRKRQYGWLNDINLGGGWLGALGSHVIDAMRWYMGSEVALCGGMSRVEVPLREDDKGQVFACTAEDAFSVWLSFENGTTATIEAASSAAVVLPQRMVILASDGAIELAEENVVTLRRGREEPQVFDLTPPADGPAWPAIRTWLAEVLAAIREGRRIGPDFGDGLATAIVLHELKRKMVRVQSPAE